MNVDQYCAAQPHITSTENNCFYKKYEEKRQYI